MRQVKSDGAKNAFVQKYVENTQTSKGWPLKGWLHHFDVHMQTLKPDTYLRCVFFFFFVQTVSLRPLGATERGNLLANFMKLPLSSTLHVFSYLRDVRFVSNSIWHDGNPGSRIYRSGS